MYSLRRIAAASAAILFTAGLAVANDFDLDLDLTLDDSACAVPPTLDDCQSFEFALTTACGIEACEGILIDAANAYGAPTSLAVDHNGDIIDGVSIFPMASPADRNVVYTPDALSYTSNFASHWLGPQNEAAFNQYAQWAVNGAEVDSCDEYVYEKYLGVTDALRLAQYNVNEPLALFDLLFGPALAPGAMGTHGIMGNAFVGRDGVPFEFDGNPFEAPPVAKNEFFDLPEPDPGEPSLGLSLFWHDFFGHAAMNIVSANYGTEQWTLSRHEQLRDGLVAEPQEASYDDTIVFDGAETIEFASLTGYVPTELTSGELLRRYLPAELTERWMLQRRFVKLKDRWEQLNDKYAGSGWTVSDLRDDDDEDRRGNPKWLADVPRTITADVLRETPRVVLVAEVFDMESIERDALLNEIIGLYLEAGELGCLDTGLTPCDWSPELFRHQLLQTTTGFIDEAHEMCTSYITTPTLDPAYTNLAIPVVNEPEYTGEGGINPLYQYNCWILSVDSFTRVSLEGLFENVETCRQQHIEYLEAKAELEAAAAALARVESNPDLIDPATGDVIAPGATGGIDQEQKDSWFGVAAEAGGAFGADVQPSECDLDLEASGYAKVTAWAGNKDIKLVDILGSVDTDSQKLLARGRVLGVNLFPEKDIDFSGGALNHQFSHEGSQTKGEGVEASVTIYVPVPITVAIGASGHVGIENYGHSYLEAFGLGNQVGEDADQCPHGGYEMVVAANVEADAFASAALGVSVAQVGVRANLTLVEANVTFTGSAGLHAAENDFGLSFPQNLQLSFDTGLTLDVVTLEGDVVLYYELGLCPGWFCSQGEVPLTSWSGFRFDKTPFSSDYNVFVGDLVSALF